MLKVSKQSRWPASSIVSAGSMLTDFSSMGHCEGQHARVINAATIVVATTNAQRFRTIRFGFSTPLQHSITPWLKRIGGSLQAGNVRPIRLVIPQGRQTNRGQGGRASLRARRLTAAKHGANGVTRPTETALAFSLVINRTILQASSDSASNPVLT